MGDLRPVYGRNFVGYGRLRHRKRPYAVVYDRRNDRPGILFAEISSHFRFIEIL